MILLFWFISVVLLIILMCLMCRFGCFSSNWFRSRCRLFGWLFMLVCLLFLVVVLGLVLICWCSGSWCWRMFWLEWCFCDEWLFCWFCFV